LPLSLLLMGGVAGNPLLPRVDTNDWGGFTLNMLLALMAIASSFPLGVLLALGRRSSLPVISLICTGFIELVRGMPLITVLFMAHLMVPLFLPDVTIDKLLRALIGFAFFTSAYIAENVR